MNRPCVICLHLGQVPRETANLVGIATPLLPIVESPLAADARPNGDCTEVVVPACPQHAADIYCGRIPGVMLTWRLADPPLSLACSR